ncbi:MAG: membrane-bound lytic murein transglycosylase MltF [Candidatus Aminicenantes bacterium]|jgi:membrane-bound lytic murein transglycosylase F
MKEKKGTFLLLVVFSMFFLSTACLDRKNLSDIKKAGRITLLTRNNAHCYYIYKDSPMGFEYELAKAFADDLGVDLKVSTPRWHRMSAALKRGRGDFIAASLTITPERGQTLNFSDEYMTIQQHVIVHKDNQQIKQLNSLKGKIVHIRKESSYHKRLLELNQKGYEIDLVLHKNIPTEELIRQVAEKEIEITVADSNIALLNRRYYPDIRIAFPINEKQSLGWAVRKGQHNLLNEINRFFQAIKTDGRFRNIHEKYYANVEIFDYLDIKMFHEAIEDRLPLYEGIIKEQAAEYDFDWRLIAAAVYQESHFDPRAKSYTGVRGLMQITQRTAKEMGIKNRLDPQQSIKGGVKYLSRLYNRFSGVRGQNRMLLTLASYNVGYGHVKDAQIIAAKKGYDPKDWSSVEKTLPLLRYPKYYLNAKYGYARGTEPIRYVKRILIYYDILKKLS